jgi:S-adenosylmethionine-diacylgycerolhomoserine-N-methlytransferase
MKKDDHAALMDHIYHYQRYLYDFTRKYYLFGRDRLIRDLNLAPGERLVEIGCGTARNLIKIAKRYPQSRLFGLDASREMLLTAERAVRKAGLEKQVRLIHGLAEDLSPDVFGESSPFDRALFSYSLSMIPDWQQAVAVAKSAVGPDGKVHVVDFGDLEGLGPGKHLLAAWLRLFHVQPRVELLHNFENAAAGNLHILPGRYAFLLTI